MARLAGATIGWESGDINENGIIIATASGGTAAVATGTPTPRTGTYCAKFASTINQNAGATAKILLPSTYTEIWTRQGIYIHPVFTGNPCPIWFASSGSAVVQDSIQLGTDSILRAWRGDNVGLLGSASQTISSDAWHLFEVRLKVDASTGIFEIWVDGNRILNLTGQNTSTLAIASIATGLCVGAIQTLGSGGYIAVDDFVANDTTGSLNNGRPGDGRIYGLIASGAGSNTNQTIGGSAPAGTNYGSTNEIPPDDGVTLVSSAVATTRDTYAMSDLPGTVAGINAVEVVARCQNDAVGAGSIGLTVKSGATTNEATAQSLSTAWAYYRALYETDPHTSAAWAVAAVNALEAGTTVE